MARVDPHLDGNRGCSHPACEWPAVASMGFDYESRLTWLEELHADPSHDRYSLCGLHAEKFRPPVGWNLDDRRGATSVVEPPVHIPRPLPVKVEAGKELASESADESAEIEVQHEQLVHEQGALLALRPLFDE